jgi:hypothetical protein
MEHYYHFDESLAQELMVSAKHLALLKRIAQGESSDELKVASRNARNVCVRVSQNVGYRHSEDLQGASEILLAAFDRALANNFSPPDYKDTVSSLAYDVPTVLVAKRMFDFDEDWETALASVKRSLRR